MEVVVAVCLLLSILGCSRSTGEHGWTDIDRAVELEARLSEADFSLLESDPEAVRLSWERLQESGELPRQWQLEFAGAALSVPPVDPEGAIGMFHSDGRLSVVYPFDDATLPSYGEIVPLAVAHYFVPETDVQVVLLLVCFQSDPKEGHAGIGVRSVAVDGREMSAPFALAVKPEELAGKFFYDQFFSMSEKHAVASRAEWNRGFLLITQLAPDAVLSTYLPWY